MELGLLAVVRAIHLMSSALVAGMPMFVSLVAQPAFRSACGSNAPSPLFDRFGKATALLTAFALVLALMSGAAWLLLLARRIGGLPLSEALGETSWTLLTQTQFGMVWQLRLCCAVVLAALLFALTRQGLRRSAALHSIAAIVGAILVGTLAWSGHGGATAGNAGTIHSIADILHLIAAAAWVGGLVPLVMLMRLGLQAPVERARRVMIHALRGFSNLGLISVATILITGLVNAWTLVDGLDGLLASGYGRLLLFKIALFVSMLGFAAVNRLQWMPRLAADDADPTEPSSRALRRIFHNAVAEIALGIAVFAIVGILGLLDPAAHVDVHMH
jgi:putative copper resistance protein D